ncbi:secreted subtilisin-like serine protease [Phycomyces blakesleeanus]|uniref:Secreted subtilisin-like serine protease n=1 Tax=Phycomyces blakesleeanus TaxID=4837 RepID=A0ABR3BA06_PHYBL
MKVNISIKQIFYLLLLALLHRGDKVRALENDAKSDSGINAPPPPLDDESAVVLPSSHRFTVQFHSPPGGDTQAAARADQDRFLDHLAANQIQFRVRYRYTNVINAISIELTPTLTSTSTSTLDQNSLFSRSIPSSIPAAASPSSPSSFKTSKNNNTNSNSSNNNIFNENNENHSTYRINKAQAQAQAQVQALRFALASHPSVKKHWAGKRYSRPTTHNTRNFVFGNINTGVEEGIANLPAAHRLTGVARVRSENISGKGIKIGILDTGVDYTHPALGGCFGPGCKIAYGYDLVGDNYGKEGKILADNDPIDTCDVAANDTLKNFQGVAPNVELGVWRIFGCEGETDDDIILQAAELAFNAGMDIINLSLGGSQNAWEEESLAVALSNLVDRGVVVIVAQGNEGKDGISQTPSPSIGRRVLTVASVDNVQRQTRTLHIINSNSHQYDFEYQISPDVSVDFDDKKYYRIMATGHSVVNSDNGSQTGAETRNTSYTFEYGCQPLDPNRFVGSVVLVHRGKCQFSRKALNVQQAGAVGLLVYNNPGEETTTIGLEGANITIPVGSINGEDGGTIFSMFSSTGDGNTSFGAAFSNQMAPIKTAGLPSLFSSWGPDAELHFKPEIAAVGGYVYSTFPVNMGSYKSMSGTSMATPYLAGCVALYMEATKHRNPDTVYRAFLNHARPIVGTYHHRLESPIKQGAGLVQVHNTIHSKSIVDPFKITLNDTEYFNKINIITITNTSNMTRLYNISHSAAIAVSGYNFTKSAVPLRRPHYKDNRADVAINETAFVLGFNQSRAVKLTFSPPNWTNTIDNPHLLYGGYIRVRSSSNNTETEVLHVPYFGSLGRQRDLPIFDTKKGYPYIGNYLGRRLSAPIDQSSGSTIDSQNNQNNQTNSTTKQVLKYDFSRANVVHLYLRLGNPTALLKGELLDTSNVSVGEIPAIRQEWLSRNDHSDTNREHNIDWRGHITTLPTLFNNTTTTTTTNNNTSSRIAHVPHGIYRIKLSALKIFGNPLDDRDWEVWISPDMTIIG